jgi:hypothetical protein
MEKYYSLYKYLAFYWPYLTMFRAKKKVIESLFSTMHRKLHVNTMKNRKKKYEKDSRADCTTNFPIKWQICTHPLLQDGRGAAIIEPSTE